jgi:hypothetical protein
LSLNESMIQRLRLAVWPRRCRTRRQWMSIVAGHELLWVVHCG